MRIFYTEKEGGTWKPLDITAPRPIFAIGLPDGTIWDPIDGIDKMFALKIDEKGNLLEGWKEVSNEHE